MEIAVATLTTDRALLLYGLPGTAKSWVSEHLAAAVSGDSTMIITKVRRAPVRNLSGMAGTMPGCWLEGPSEKALVETPVMRSMKEGKIVRIEEVDAYWRRCAGYAH